MSTITLTNIFTRIQSQTRYQLLIIAIGTLTLAISAQISIPWQPVPLTFQSSTVILLGLVLGWRLGAQIVLSYLFVGALGIPVFANFSGGLPVLYGPTAGYLYAFLPAAILAGYLAQHGWARNWGLSFFAAILAVTIIFIGGVIGLQFFVGWKNAVLLGVLPFIVTEPIKLLVAGIFAPFCWKKNTLNS